METATTVEQVNTTDSTKVAKSEAVRQALAAGITENSAIQTFVQEKFGMDIDSRYISVLKSNAKHGKVNSNPNVAKKDIKPSKLDKFLDDIDTLRGMVSEYGVDNFNRLVEAAVDNSK